MPYDKLLFMSYAVPTFYPAPTGPVAAAGGAPAVNLNDPDLQARAQRFVNVLYWTAQQFANAKGMQDSKTLKLFMAPEFYFRKASTAGGLAQPFALANFYGSYPEAARYELAEAIYGAVQPSALFKDWTIVAGTICSVLPLAPDAVRLDLLNTTIVLRGQRAQMDEAAPYVLMEKHYISNIDGPPQAWHANLNPATVFSYRLNPDQALDNLIRWDGLTNGVEVCLDHRCGLLSEAMIRLSVATGPGIPRIDLQLITSCGMDIIPQFVVVKDGALVLLTDGMSHAASGYPTPLTHAGRYVQQGNLFGVLDVPLPALQPLPAGNANYNVNYPNYAGQQGVYAFDPLALLQQ